MTNSMTPALSGTKPWYASKGVIGPIVATLALIAGFFGIEIDEATQAVIIDQGTALLTAAVAFGGIVLGLIGRVTAAKKIG
jgi:hypothetical protein